MCTNTYSSFEKFLEACHDLSDKNQVIEWVPLWEMELEAAEKKTCDSLNRKIYNVRINYERCVVQVSKIRKDKRMKTVSSIRQIRELVAESEDTTFALAGDLGVEQIDNLLKEVEDSNDLILLEFDTTSVPKTVTLGKMR